MKRELLRCVCQPLYWVVVGGGLAVRAALALLDRLYRPELFWALSTDFWNKIGSATEGALIVLVLIRLMSIDRECETQPMILSTTQGRRRLLWERLGAGTCAAVIGVSLLALGNLVITTAFGRGLSCPEGWIGKFFLYSDVALAGSVGFFLLCSCVCDMVQSQQIAMCVCGLPFAASYFISTDIAHPPEPFWFCRYGCFTELMRGRFIQSVPGFWIGWYSVLLLGVLLLTLRLRKERKEL